MTQMTIFVLTDLLVQVSLYFHQTTVISVILFLQLQYKLSFIFCENYIQLLCLLDVCEFSQDDDKRGGDSVHGAGRGTQVFAACKYDKHAR